MNNNPYLSTPVMPKKKASQITPEFERFLKDQRELRQAQKEKSKQKNVARKLKFGES